MVAEKTVLSSISETDKVEMKNFWALPAFLRLAIASQHSFHVFDDVLAHPQVRPILYSPI